MDHHDHVNLLRDGVLPDGTWADLGAGSGAFTLALADLLGPGGRIIAVDRDARALRLNASPMIASFPGTTVEYIVADFTRALDIPPLDGIVMANSLHFQRDHLEAVRHIRGYLKPGGRLVIVEYNIERANYAVTHPVPYSRWETLAREAGFAHTRQLFTRPSRNLREIYSALSW